MVEETFAPGMTVSWWPPNIYGHHHLDHLRAARDAFDRAPKLRQRLPATEREQTLSNLNRICDGVTRYEKRQPLRRYQGIRKARGDGGC
jgi:hypothetical protein